MEESAPFTSNLITSPLLTITLCLFLSLSKGKFLKSGRNSITYDEYLSLLNLAQDIYFTHTETISQEFVAAGPSTQTKCYFIWTASLVALYNSPIVFFFSLHHNFVAERYANHKFSREFCVGFKNSAIYFVAGWVGPLGGRHGEKGPLVSLPNLL